MGSVVALRAPWDRRRPVPRDLCGAFSLPCADGGIGVQGVVGVGEQLVDQARACGGSDSAQQASRLAPTQVATADDERLGHRRLTIRRDADDEASLRAW